MLVTTVFKSEFLLNLWIFTKHAVRSSVPYAVIMTNIYAAVYRTLFLELFSNHFCDCYCFLKYKIGPKSTNLSIELKKVCTKNIKCICIYNVFMILNSV